MKSVFKIDKKGGAERASTPDRPLRFGGLRPRILVLCTIPWVVESLSIFFDFFTLLQILISWRLSCFLKWAWGISFSFWF